MKEPTCHRCSAPVQVIVRKIGTVAELRVCRTHADPYTERPDQYSIEILVETLRQCDRCGRLIFKNASPKHHRWPENVPCEEVKEGIRS